MILRKQLIAQSIANCIMANFPKYLLLGVSLLIINTAWAQSKYTISGYIRDASNGEELIGATVFVNEIGTGSVTNAYGFYSITLPEGEYTIKYSYVSYETVIKTINLDNDLQINVDLAEEVKALGEIVITGEAEDKNVEDISMSSMKVDIQQVKKLPPLFGEVDIIKTIQLMPGVLVSGEGSSAYFVRGGNVDHNLILLDEAPIYDPSHLFGLISVFNSSIVKNSELFKGGIPAQYGGRLASILDVRTKDGNNRKFGGEAGVGILSSKLMVEGPIVPEKASFIISGRRSYFDLFIPDDAIIKPYFYDINAKVNVQISQNDNLFLSYYNGRDRMDLLDNLFRWDWGNRTGTIRWNHIFSNKLFSNATFIYSNFDYENVQDFPGFGVEWTANLREYSGKIDFEYYINPKNTIKFGLHNSYRTFRPGTFIPTSEESTIANVSLQNQFAWDNALYLSHKLDLSDRLSMEYGLRLSRFAQVGNAKVISYEEAETPELQVNSRAIDSTFYGAGETVISFLNPEPRFSARYKTGANSSVKLSYNRMVQYVHQMVTGTSPLPIAVWQPSTTHIDPQIADQLAAGYFKNLNNNTYETSIEIYYKWMNDIVDFVDNANIFFNEDLPLQILPGKSTSYGAEFLIRKTKGNLKGWLSYTWSKTTREIPGINNGQEFPASYDRRHNATLVTTYDINDRLSLGSSWIFGTGRGLTLPSGKYTLQGQVVDLYTGRNEYRMPPFHRLDLALTWYSKDKPGRWWSSETSFSVYNLYGRRNPYIIFTQPPEDGSDNFVLLNYDENGNIVTGREVTQVNLFGILPSISYTFKF